ncbi:MAG: CpaE family protein [Pseudomonadota bacterium]
MSEPAHQEQAHMPQPEHAEAGVEAAPAADYAQSAVPEYGHPEEQVYSGVHETPSEDLSTHRPVPRVAIQAFCESEGVASVIEAASRDRRMSKAHVKVQLGGIAAAVDFYQTATTPNLIMIESGLVGAQLIAELEKLAEVCDEGTNVVVVGHKNDVQLYRDLISRGVAEYLVAPVSMSDVMDIVTTLFVNPDAAPLGQTIAFVGAKGGVGSSTIAHNVAWAIASNFESDVVLADLDLAFGTANIDFDQDPAQGVAEAVFSADRIDETYLDRLLAKCSDHLSLLAAPSTLDREYDFHADDFNQLLEVAQRGTPNVVIDLPHMWTGWTRQILAAADKVVITATPDLASLRNTKNLVDTLADLRPNDGKPFLVLNQCNVPKRPEIAIDDFTGPLDMEPSVVIPFDPALFGLAANNGQMISETDAKSEVASSLDLLAQIITGRREIQDVAKSPLGGLLSRFALKKK